MKKSEFEMEQSYLTHVYGNLVTQAGLLKAFLDETKDESINALKIIGDDITLNFDNFAENIDTFATIEMKSREIDQMNIKVDTADAQYQNIKRLLENPYFGKVDVTFVDETDCESFYIGIHNFADDDRNNLIYDWRSPIAELFYNNDIGPSAYEANNRLIDVNINQRRQFIIDKTQLIKFFDTTVSIQDDILLETLEQDSSNEMKDITSTIQQEQNEIIRDTHHRNILVNGIAGSGKTSTIMQRIAYLLYLYRNKVASKEILILSPNNKFIEYISNVLPSLGEKNPINLTFLQFINEQSDELLENESEYFSRINDKSTNKQIEILRSASFTHHIKSANETLINQTDFIQNIKHHDKIIISSNRIKKIFLKMPQSNRLIDKVSATSAQLLKYWKNRIKKEARKKSIQDEILSLPESLQKKYFGKLISDDSDESINSYGEQLLHIKYKHITESIKQNKWVNTKFIFEQLYTDYSHESYIYNPNRKILIDEAVIFLTIKNEFINRLDLQSMKFILIDEIQDYTPAQISLILDLYPTSQFTLVGDENQAIFNSSMTFTEIAQMFNAHNHSVKTYDLLNSYRSSGHITKLFKKLVTSQQHLEIVPIRHEGNPPQFIKLQDISDLTNNVQQILRDIHQDTLTIITKDDKDKEYVERLLKKGNIDMQQINIYPISLSKGLEFDHVLIFNVNEDEYVSKRDKKILYTAISRSMQNIYITYQSKLPWAIDKDN